MTLYAPAADLHAAMMRRVVIDVSGCWVFAGCVNSKGYGCVSSGRKGKTVLAHRLAVIVRDGSIPDDLTVDHLCGRKRCVRPDHLEVVTRSENSKRWHRSRWTQAVAS